MTAPDPAFHGASGAMTVGPARRAGRQPAGTRRGGGIRLVALVGLLLLLLAPLSATAQDSNNPTIVSSDNSSSGDASDDNSDNSSGSNASAAPGSNGDWQPPRTVYIPETGQTIDGVFLDFWRNGGGADAYGNPITPEFQLNGHTVQYYGYARFEYWPDDPNGNVVHLGNIGAELRPFMLRRALPGFGGVGGDGSQAAREASKATRAWLSIPVGIGGADSDTHEYIAATHHTVSDGFKTFWENSGGADYLGNPLTEEFVQDSVTYQIFERGELAWKPNADVWMVPLGSELAKRYHLNEAPVDQGDIPTYSEDLFVPPPSPSPSPSPAASADDQDQQAQGQEPDPNAEKWIEVNLSDQSLIAWQGDVQVLTTLVSTGRPGFETPTGTFHILDKLDSQTMEGVIGGEYYNVPDVPWVMYFTDRGHALHGTYWHNNFGNVMSHGCVNLPMDVAEWMYSWAPIGTRVEIHY